MEVHVRSTCPPAKGDGAGPVVPRGSDRELLETCRR
jgi:hypothetical protein